MNNICVFFFTVYRIDSHFFPHFLNFYILKYYFWPFPRKHHWCKLRAAPTLFPKTQWCRTRFQMWALLPDPCISSTSAVFPSASFPTHTLHLCDWLALCRADLCVRSRSPRLMPPAAGPASLPAEPPQRLWSPRPPWSPLSSPLTWDTQVFNHFVL